MNDLEAKMRPLKQGAYKVKCGRPYCTAVLGIASTKPKGSAMTVQDAVIWAAREHAGDPARSRWTLHAPLSSPGYAPGAQHGEYRLMRAERVPSGPQQDRWPRARRAMTRRLQSGADTLARRPSKSVIGQYPSLPATIICPQCGRSNLVPVPQGE